MQKLFLLLMLWALATLAGAQETWTPLGLADGQAYYLLNVTAGRFVSGGKSLSAGQPQRFEAHLGEDGSCVLRVSDDKALCLSITPNDGLLGGSAPKALTVGIDTLATAFGVTEADGCYMLSVTATWKYGLMNRNSATCTAHLSALIDAETGGATLAASTDAADTCSLWMLVGPDEFAQSGVARSAALERLAAAISAVDAALRYDLPTITKTSLTALQTAARATLSAAQSSLSWISSRVTNDQINQSAEGLEQAVAGVPALSDCYVACKAEVDNVEQLGGLAVSAACVTARGALAASGTIGAMAASMTVLRAALLGYLQTLEVLPDSTDLTGALANPSFERGVMDGWYTLSVDASGLAGAAGAIGKGDLGGLADLVSIADFGEHSMPVRNTDAAAMEGGHGRFYYRTDIPGSGLLSAATGQPAVQPIIGLPDGDYRLAVQMHCQAGALGTQACYVSLVTVPGSVIREVLGDLDLTKLTDVSYITGLLTENLGPLLQQASVQNGNVRTREAGRFGTASVDFRVEDGTLVLAVLNAGLLPMVGTDPFRADDVRLTYLQPIPVPGDVNGDRRLSIADIVAAITLILNPEAEGLNPETADMDGDGRVTAADVERLAASLRSE